MTRRATGGGSMASTLSRALALHQDGKLQQAQRLYRQVLAREPDNANALNLLGLIEHQQGRHDTAVTLIERAVRRNPNSTVFLRNLALAQQAAGQTEEAIASFQRAHDLDPGDAEILNDLGTVLNATGRIDAAADAFRRAAARAPDAGTILYNLGNAELKRGQKDAARRALERALSADPGLERARHILDAMTGRQTAAPPDDYVRHLFEDYAGRFDEDLVGNLGYRVPELLRQALDRLADAPRRFDRALDLGCGTGLSGAAFRDLCDELTGIDLSPSMIDRARQRGVYDLLFETSIADMLAADSHRFGFVLATDVLVYVGDLAPLFTSLPERCSEGALFLLSVETADGSGFVLRDSGRYAHAPAYIAEMATGNGFEVLVREAVDIRKGEDGPVAGEIYVLRRG